jgi:hypothetical protein
MATLGGINIGTGLYKEVKHQDCVQSIMQRARSDDILVWERESGPQAFDLVGTANTGALKKSIVDQIETLAEGTQTTFDLVYDNETISVMFRHWEGEVIEVNGLVTREKMTANDYYNNIRIKLHEAEWR